MSKTTISNIQQLLDAEKLQFLLGKVEQLSQFNTLLQDKLEPNLAKHCRVANINPQKLTLEVDSSAWAMRLRYQIPQLLNQLRANGLKDLQEIHYYIQPVSNKPSLPGRKPNRLSTENAQLIKEMANSISDPSLSTALLKLSQQTLK